MGGYGSTRWNNAPTRGTTGESLALSTAAFASYVGTGNCAVDWTWERNGKAVGKVRGVVGREAVLLRYSVTGVGGDAGAVQDTLPLAWTACTYGGTRPWFVCSDCERCRRALYLPPSGSRFRCGECHDLAYSSTRMDALERATARVRAVQRHLKPTGGHDPFAVPPRPKGMRATTYERIRGELWECQMQRDEIFSRELAALTKRLDKVMKR